MDSATRSIRCHPWMIVRILTCLTVGLLWLAKPVEAQPCLPGQFVTCDVPGHVCVGGTMTSPGQCGAPLCGPQSLPCARGEACIQFECVKGCTTSMDCTADQECRAGACKSLFPTMQCDTNPTLCQPDEFCNGTTCEPRGTSDGPISRPRPVPPPQVACVSTLADLVAALRDSAKDIIVVAPGTYLLTAVDNETDGPNGLPSVRRNVEILSGQCELTSGGSTSVQPGGRATLRRVIDAPPFRIVHVAREGILRLERLTVSGGVAPQDTDGGGGILNLGDLTLQSSIVTENSTDPVILGSPNTALPAIGGGGILNRGGLAVLNTTIALNDSEGFFTDGGGGILNLGALLVENSTIAGNQADDAFGGGGGVLNAGGGKALIRSSTIARNRAVTGFNGGDGGGGVLNTGDFDVSITNSIIAQNVGVGQTADPATNCRNSGNGQITSEGHNMSNSADCGFGAGNNIDPQLDTLGPLGLQENGGPTPTIALLSGSPAIDTGDTADCPDFDQRGLDRGSCDIGAFEFGVGRLNDLFSNDSVTAVTIPPASAIPGIAPLPKVITFITASFTNRGSSLILFPFFQVTDLTGGNLLLNADDALGGLGVGSTLTPRVPGTAVPLAFLFPGDSVTVTFEILLATGEPFSFLVNLLGRVSPF